MPYKSEVYQRALNILQHRRDDSTLDVTIKTREAMEKIPELEELQIQLSKIGLSISKLLFRSENPKEELEALQEQSLALQEKKKQLLKKNGFSENALEPQYICPVCRDTGFVGDRMCNCHRELLKEIERDNIRRLAPIDDCTFDSFKTEYYPEEGENGISPRKKAEKILEACRGYAQSFGPNSKNLLLMGGTGLGKTHLSLAIANVAINKGYAVLYGTAQNILSDLQNENFGRLDNIYYTEHDVLHADLLIIDDLGTEFKNQYSVASLYNIINTRILRGAPTVISTNFTLDDLERDYNQRITSRLLGEYSTLVLEGTDIRYLK
jgi:DNA replication protein DnaC